jgi:MATE family multidrug resistance protein
MEGAQTDLPARGDGAAGEAALLARIAVPLGAAYLAEVAMFLTTKLVVGRLGYHELAAVGLAGSLAMELLFVLMGALSIIGVMVAQAEGAGSRAEAGHATRQGIILAAALALPAIYAVWNLDWVMHVTGQDALVVELAGPYLHAAAGFMLPALLFAVLRSFVSALARTGAVMVITVASVGLNYVLTVGLVEGAYYLPALGVAGAGWALTIVTWIMFAALIAYTYFSPALRGYGLFRGRLRFDPALCAEIIRLGIPVAGIVIFESGLFIAVSILSGTFGAVALAAAEILLAWVAIAYVFGLGFAEATMIRVANCVGRGAAAGARRAGILGMAIGVGILVILVVPPLSVPELIVRVFLEPGAPGFEEVSAIATSLLAVVALFQVFDALQGIAVRALRGLRDTLAPLWIAGIGYWLFGIGGGWLLAYPFGWGAAGLWWGMALGLAVTGCLLAWRFVALADARSSLESRRS